MMPTPSATAAADPVDLVRDNSPRVDDRIVLWIILGGYLLMGAWYSVAVPAFETPDEIYHYAFARHLAQGNWLPVQSDEPTGPWQQEGSQAPLYYMLTGWLTAGADQSDFAAISVFNPRANMGNPLYPGNKNRMLYSSAPRPMRGSNLALHIGRWISLMLGAVTLWLVYRTAKLSFSAGSRLPVVAALLVAFTPQFLFMSASFSNDNMIIVASAAVLYWLANILTKSAARSIRLWEWSALGVLLGIAALSKLQGLGLWLLAGGVGLAVARKRRSWSTLLIAALGVAIPALLVAGWWYWRNQTLYGDWSGIRHLTAINGLRQKPLDLDDFWLEFRGLRYSFWGLFGWFNILLPSWFYAAMDLFSVVAAIGALGACLIALRRSGASLLHRVTAQIKLMLLAWIALSLALLLYWMMRATGSQGRLVFPAIGAIAIWFVIGIDFWTRPLPQPWRTLAWSIAPGLLLVMSLYSVAVAIPHSYAAPRQISVVPSGARPALITYGDSEVIQLLAVETEDQRYRPGESVPVTLYLTAPHILDRDYELFVQLLDTEGNVLGNITSHPGWGSNPTSLWQPGVIYADEYELPVTGPVDPRSPILARLYTGFIDPDTQPELNHPMTARDVNGNEITPIVGEVRISPHDAPAIANLGLLSSDIAFGEGLDIAGLHVPASIQAGAAITTTLLWSPRARPGADYTAFLHLLDTEGRYVAGFDQAPAPGHFPTSYWNEGDRIVSEIAIDAGDVAPGEYELWLGLYESVSGGEKRLPITQPDGHAVQNDMLNIGTVSVEPE